MAQKRIALIICSIRKPRVCPAIASWITSVIPSPSSPNVTLATLDLADYRMPLSISGSTIPGKVKTPLGESPYEDAEVNRWSRTVRSYDGFIFVTPQYNWSVPGSLKVALDHLFYEWAGKPMLVVSYGGNGGAKGSAHLKDVWKGLRGGECVGGVELSIQGESMERSQKEGVLEVSVGKTWEGSGKDRDIREGWGALLGALGGQG